MSEPKGDEGTREKGWSRWQCRCRETARRTSAGKQALGLLAKEGRVQGLAASSCMRGQVVVAGRGTVRGQVGRCSPPCCHAPLRTPRTLGLELFSVSTFYLPTRLYVIFAAKTTSYLVSLVCLVRASCSFDVVAEQMVVISEVLESLLTLSGPRSLPRGRVHVRVRARGCARTMRVALGVWRL